MSFSLSYAEWFISTGRRSSPEENWFGRSARQEETDYPSDWENGRYINFRHLLYRPNYKRELTQRLLNDVSACFFIRCDGKRKSVLRLVLYRGAMEHHIKLWSIIIIIFYCCQTGLSLRHIFLNVTFLVRFSCTEVLPLGMLLLCYCIVGYLHILYIWQHTQSNVSTWPIPALICEDHYNLTPLILLNFVIITF